MKRFLKIAFGAIFSFFFLVFLVLSVLQSEAGQKKLRAKLVQILSDELRTKVSVGHIGWNPIDGVRVKDIYVRDQLDDTLFYIQDLKAKLKFLNRTSQFVYLKKVQLDGVVVNFRQYSGDNFFNYEFFFEALTPKTDPNDTSDYIPWTILFEDLKLRNTCFIMRMDDDTVIGRKFNESNMRLENIQADLRDFYLVDDSLNFYVKNLVLTEHNSFKINCLNAKSIISRHGMYFSDIVLETPNSSLRDYFAMEYEDWRAFNNFYDSVKMTAHLKGSKVSFLDIRLFTDNLASWDAELMIDGKGSGALRNLLATNLDIQYGQNTRIQGNVKINGLPNIDVTVIEAEIEKATGNRKELASLIPMDLFPLELDRLGNIAYSGKYTGTISNFIAEGEFITDIGFLRTNIEMHLGEEESYSGRLESVDFDFGKFFEIPEAGLLTFEGNINGKSFELNKMEAHVDAKVTSIGLFGYNYHNLTVDGTLRNQFFDGELVVRDPNLDMTFKGIASLAGEIPSFDCVSKINRLELAALNLAPDFPLMLAGELILDFSGTNLDNLLGSIAVKNVEIEKDKRIYYVDYAMLKSDSKDGMRSLQLKSDIVDASLTGNFKPSLLDKSLNNFLAQLLPNMLELERVELADQQFTFKVNFKETKEITSLIAENTWVNNGSLNGAFNSVTSSLSVSANIESAHLNEFEFHTIVLRADSSVGDNTFNIQVTCAEVLESDSIMAHGLSFDFDVGKDDLSFDIRGFSDTYLGEVNLLGDLKFSPKDIQATFKSSTIRIDTSEWTVGNNSQLRLIEKKTLELDSFTLTSKEQVIFLDGQVLGGENDNLSIDFDKFNLASLNRLLFPESDMSIQGMAQGNFEIKSFNGKLPLFTSDLRIDQLGVNGDGLGNLTLKSRVPKGMEIITVNGILQDGPTQRINLSGFVNTSKSNNGYNLKLEMDTTPLNLFEPFLTGLVSDLRGVGRGRVEVSGPLNSPILKGKLFLDNAGMRVDYLNTVYNFSTVVNVSSSRIDIGRFKITDQNNNTGYCSGYIGHEYLSKFDLHIELNNLNNFMCLNTTIEDNPLYYGTALMSGSARFIGPLEDLKIDVKGKAEKGSAFFIPLENYGGSSELEFIRFVSFDSYGSSQPYQDLSGIQMRFDLEITPSTEIQLIFDSKLGDIIRARGYSKLLMEINSNGDFKMYGDYEVEEGDYLFTAINLINKKFVIKKGGKITWNGDPMKANLNLEASYRTKATLENLVTGIVQADEIEAYKQRTDVEALMKLRGELTAPEIRFGFLLPNLSTLSSSGVNVSTLQTVIRRIETDQEEMTRQVFSLLVANTFIRPAVNQQYMAGGSDVQSGLLSSSVGDLLSNQVSNWLGQINTNWNFGVNYVMGTQQSDLLINASRKFLDDRLEIEGTFGTTTNFYNNVSAMYTITPDGRFRVRAFNRTGMMQNGEQGTANTNGMNRNINTQGFGLQYSIDFDLLDKEKREIRRRLLDEKKEPENQ